MPCVTMYHDAFVNLHRQEAVGRSVGWLVGGERRKLCYIIAAPWRYSSTPGIGSESQEKAASESLLPRAILGHLQYSQVVREFLDHRVARGVDIDLTGVARHVAVVCSCSRFSAPRQGCWGPLYILCNYLGRYRACPAKMKRCAEER